MNADTVALELRLRILANRINTLEQRAKRLLDDNRRVRESRDLWKLRHRGCAKENTALKHRVKRITASRDMWQQRACFQKTRRERRPNVRLSARDLQQILEMEPRP